MTDRNKVKPRRSYTANSVPLTTDLETHELAINWTDGKAFTKNAAGQIVTITLGGSGGGSVADDARWEYFKPAAPTSVTAVAGNAQAVVSWTAPAVVVPPITDYIVQFSTDSGSTWTAAAEAITITTQPSNQTAASGAATFSVAATVSPSGTATYQWQKSDDAGTTFANVSGANSATLSLTSLTNGADNNDQYRVIVSAVGAAPVTSSAATLTVAASAGLVVTTAGSGTGSWSGAGTEASPFVRSEVGAGGSSSWADPVFTASGSGSVRISWASRSQGSDFDPDLYVQKNNITVQTVNWSTSGASISAVSVVSGDTVQLATQSNQLLNSVSVWIE
jgi:hypothetical protein